ncbi:serpin family protein [Streptomyces sp. NPDC020807]|uniref:serpin family protein n=1 Tax=Streptomyces sp. NPDC020807 TaxID=3155119 RepID=UPI0033E782ED
MTRGSSVIGTDAAGAVRGLAGRWVSLLGDGDFVVSPVGLWLALAAVASGARGRTAEELAGLLRVEGAAAAEAVTGASRAWGADGGVTVATGVWSTLPIREAFERGLPDVRFGQLPGDSRQASAQEELDAWVRGTSGGLVRELPLGLDGSEDLVLLSVLALRARWRVAFAPELTRDAPFTDGDGVTRGVPTMRQRIPARWAWTVAGATVVELPCAGEGSVRVRFVLGADGEGPADVLPAAWAPAAAREALRADAAELALPRFALRTKTDAHAHLESLGVRMALRPDADFSGISAVATYVARVLQEAVVEVGEEGVEAAAVTQVVMTRSAAAPRPRVVERIAFDRPFGVVVVDGTGGVPLFVGWRRGTPSDRDEGLSGRSGSDRP